MNNNSLDQLLGIPPDATANVATVEGEIIEVSPDANTSLIVSNDLCPTVVVPPAANVAQELESDFQHGRKVIKDAIDAVRPALDSAILLAQSGDSPRAYEVVGKLLENIVHASKELAEIHRSKKEITEQPVQNQSLLPQDGGQTVNIDKAVFVGRASDLLREIKQLQKVAEAATQVDEQ